MVPESSIKFSAVNLRVKEKEEDQDLDGGNVFGHKLRREELRIGGENLGIGMDGRRPLKRRWSTWNCRAN